MRVQVYEITTPDPPDAVHERLLTQLTPYMQRVGKFSLVAQDSHSLTYTRRQTPTWAVVLAIIGLVVFLLGLLFLLVKETQTILISLSPGESGGTRILITGARTPKVEGQVRELVSSGANPRED